MRGTIEPEQKVRWLNDDRTYAPWQYAEEAMLRSADGQLHVPPATAKEQFHQLPINYTEVDGVSDRSRHRLLGNGWHLGTARFMMMLVLQMVMTTSSTAVPTKPQQSAIQTMMDVMGSFPRQWARALGAQSQHVHHKLTQCGVIGGWHAAPPIPWLSHHRSSLVGLNVLRYNN